MGRRRDEGARPGFVLVDKPPGPTSHDVVDIVRRALGTRRVGHAGTLDPPASGLVVIGVGAATRLLRFVQQQPKTYEAEGVLGVRTSTLDAEGEVLSETPAEVSEAELSKALAALTGRIDQVPPAVSAVKVGGERAYRLAARGADVRLEPRSVEVYELDLLTYEPPRFTVRIRCSSGTYVRSLIADAGDALGCGAHVAWLRRTAIGSLHAADGYPPGDVTPACVIEVPDALRDMPLLDVDPDTAARLRHGQRPATGAPDGEVLVVAPDGPVGVAEARDGTLRPVVVLS